MATNVPTGTEPAYPFLDTKYRVRGILGDGGMGVVYEADHLGLGVAVAIKVLREEHLCREDIIERLMREARTVAKLRSEHAARVLDVGRAPSGSPYIVMERLEGSDLGDVLAERGPLMPEVAVSLILQAAEALGEAHALGIVHRDVKPENLFLTFRSGGEPIVKVLDFGVAKPVDLSSARSLTSPDVIVGSPDYLAPEGMKQGGRIEATADVWSLGVVLYELVTGQRPFEAETVPEICARVLRDTPTSVSDLAPEVPDGLVAIITRCLAKEPTERYPNVGELALALAPYGGRGAQRQAERVRRIAAGQNPHDVDGMPLLTASGVRLRAPIDAAADASTSPTSNGKRLAIAFGIGLAAAATMAMAWPPPNTTKAVSSLAHAAARPLPLPSSDPDAPSQFASQAPSDEAEAEDDDAPVAVDDPSQLDELLAERERRIAILESRLAEMARLTPVSTTPPTLSADPGGDDSDDTARDERDLAAMSADELYERAEQELPVTSPAQATTGDTEAAFRNRF